MKEPLLKKMADRLVKPLLTRYLQKERRYRYKGFDLVVLPGVFHPAFFFSTKYLFDFIDRQNLEGHSCLEVGSGSGLISLLMATKAASVTAIDISSTAVENIEINFKRNEQKISSGYRVLKSDLFEKLSEYTFDTIVINPPYFFNAVNSESQYAWNCGPEGEYFVRLFKQLGSHVKPGGRLYMILADNCDIRRISDLAGCEGWTLRELERRKIWWETNFIYAIEPGTSVKIG
ncbi:MAG: methyltransferase [Bacteroidetes bacterium]|nr:methyltransferase [Bacteroidota bacterium]